MVRALTALEPQECRILLRGCYLGRLAFLRDGRPDIVPLNYRVHGDAVLLRVAAGPLLAAIADADVAFEVDDVDAIGHTGWDVVVHGTARDVTDEVPSEVPGGVPALRLRPWAPGRRDRVVAVPIDAISGRRIGPAPAPSEG